MKSGVTNRSSRVEPEGCADPIMSPSSSRTSPQNLDPKRAVLYLRASTRRQELSPSAQREMVAEWAKSKGIESWPSSSIMGSPGLPSWPSVPA